MLINEITIVDEGWKSNIAKAGMTAALALGSGGMKPSSDTVPAPMPTVAPAKSSLKDVLMQTAQKAGIKGHELAQFLAQTAHESLNFTRMVERGSTSYIAKKYDIAHNPSKASRLGNTDPGDGERYKGRGFIQLTGRYNYAKAGADLGIPLEKQPDLAADPAVAAKIAVWYWAKRVQPRVTDFTDVSKSTKPINSGLEGLEDRQEKYDAFKVELGLEDK